MCSQLTRFDRVQGAERTEAQQLEDPTVRQLHASLVGTGVMTNEDFWAQRRQQLASTPDPKRPQASTGGSEREHTIESKSDTVTIQVTAAEIKRIFKEQPSVLAKYKAMVPHQMSEVAFWTQYMESTMFHRRRHSHDAGAEASMEEAGPSKIVDRRVDLSKELDAPSTTGSRTTPGATGSRAWA